MSDSTCYLIWELQHNGTLTCLFSRSELAQFLAKAVASKPFPAHKFQGSGKQQIRTKASAAKDYYQSWCEWLRDMKRAGATVTIPNDMSNSPHPVMVVLHDRTNHVHRVTGGDIKIADYDAVAVCHPSTQDFKTPTIEITLFLEKVRAQYGGIAL